MTVDTLVGLTIVGGFAMAPEVAPEALMVDSDLFIAIGGAVIAVNYYGGKLIWEGANGK